MSFDDESSKSYALDALHVEVTEIKNQSGNQPKFKLDLAKLDQPKSSVKKEIEPLEV